MKQELVRRIWLPAFYFLYFGAGACLAPFLAVYLRKTGLSPGSVGLLVALPPLVLLFGGPVWSGIADAFRRHRPVMLLAMSVAAAFALLIPHSAALGWLVLLIAGYAFFSAPIMPIADNATLGLLGEHKERYGRIRLWGGVAWGVIGPLIGVITERGGLTWPFLGYAALMLVAIPVSTRVPLTRGGLAEPFWRGLRTLLLDRRWYVFLTAVFVCGMALSSVTNFLFLYIAHLGGDATLMGLSLTAATVSELPFFVLTNLLVRRIGPHRLFLVGMMAFVVRFLLYSLIHNPWAALAVQLLHGPSFVAIWVAGVSYADSMAPPGLGATAQSIFSATLMGLGSAAGGIVSGALFGAVGPLSMYRILALVVLAGFGGFWAAHASMERSRRSGPTEQRKRSAQAEIALPLAARLVAAQFPQWDGLPLRPVDEDGWDNRTFRLGEQMCVRMPSGEQYALQVEKEQRWLPKLAPLLPLAIPEPLAMGRPGEGYPWNWSIYRWIEGEPAAAERIDDLPAFAATLARFLVALEQVDPAGGPPPGPHNFHRGAPPAVYDGETRKALAELAGEVDAAAATDVWEAALASEWQGPPVWVHGDVAVGNLLVWEGRLSAVIDFGSSAVGDPACDLTIAWTFLFGASREAFRAALPADEGTWARGRGWTLWKALITLAACRDTDARKAAWARRAIEEVLTDHRSSP